MSEPASWLSHAEFIVLLFTLIRIFYILDRKIVIQSSQTDTLHEMLSDFIEENHEKKLGKD